MKKLVYLFHTLRFLKLKQIYARAWHRLYQPRPVLKAAVKRRPASGRLESSIQKCPSMIGPERFRFLNQEYDIKEKSDWNRPDIGRLWLYNLHYFDDLNAEGAENREEWHRHLISRWIKENPPFEGTGWEPYPTSLRIVNWIKWALQRQDLPEGMQESLALQAKYLSRRLEYHLLGNHLFANAKAMVFAGQFFEGGEALKWGKTGLAILEKEIAEQVLPDGGHFERSPMYHAVILEDLLDLVNLFRAYEQTPPKPWLDAIKKMRQWLSIVCHPDGDIALFNDSAFGIAPNQREIEDYAGRLQLGNFKDPETGIQYLADSGIARVEKGDAVALLDVGRVGPDYIPGHAHADTLSFEFSLFGKRIVVDSGISTYEKNAARQWERSTAAHNTVTIDGQNSSEVWGGFRVARRARPFGFQQSNDGTVCRVSCAHDGYRRLPGKPVHSRQWILSDHELMVRDTVRGAFREAIARFYFHPEVAVHMVAPQQLGGMLASGQNFSVEIEKGVASLVDSTWQPEFNTSVANKCLEVRLAGPEASVRLVFPKQSLR